MKRCVEMCGTFLEVEGIEVALYGRRSPSADVRDESERVDDADDEISRRHHEGGRRARRRNIIGIKAVRPAVCV